MGHEDCGTHPCGPDCPHTELYHLGLTKAQARILHEVRAQPGRVYTGRNWRAIKVLVDKKLVTAEFEEWRRTTWWLGDRITVRPT